MAKLTRSLWWEKATAVVACLALVGAILPAQQEPKFSVQVKVVNVPATVRDKHGKIVHDLTKDDFVLEEDSRPQSIHYFSQENDLPLTLGLLVDTSFSQVRVLDQERTASFSFLDDMLRPERDLAFLIHFDFDTELLEDLTDSREKLRKAMDALQAPDLDRQRGGNSPGSGPGYPRHRGGRGGSGSGGGTVLYDAIYLASNELMQKQTGRKAVVILSDGVDHGSKESLRAAIEAAQRADTMVYAIFFKGDEPSGFGRMGGMGGHHGGHGRFPQEQPVDGKKILEQISKETGGRTFEASGKDAVSKIYRQIEEELRNQYSLGYTPDRPDPGAGYHKISLKTKQKDLVVQARAGYYARGN